MPGPLAYPATRHDTSPLIDLSRKEERARLSASAVKAFFNIMQRWKVRDEDARLLLGGMSNGTYYELKKQPDRVLDEDRMLRISYLIGIFKSLHILHAAKLADAWIGLPNSGRIFRGQTPLGFMLRHGLPGLQTVRRLLDARRGGV